MTDWYDKLTVMCLAPVGEFRAFARRSRGLRFSSERAARICQMKLRIALPGVSRQDKAAARAWLTAHGCSHDISTIGPRA